MKYILLNAPITAESILNDLGISFNRGGGSHIVVWKQKKGNAYNTYYEWMFKRVSNVRLKDDGWRTYELDRFINKLKEVI